METEKETEKVWKQEQGQGKDDEEGRMNSDLNRVPSVNSGCPRDVLHSLPCALAKDTEKFFKFAFVRHPKDRSISQVDARLALPFASLSHFFFSLMFLHSLKLLLTSSLSHHTQYAMAASPAYRIKGFPFPSFEKFILRGPRSLSAVSTLSPIHFVPQTSFLFDKRGCPTVDYIGRLETLEEDMLKILEILNVPALWKGYKRYGLNLTVDGMDGNEFGTEYRRSHSVVFTEEMQKSFLARYGADLDNFGFSFVAPPT